MSRTAAGGRASRVGRTALRATLTALLGLLFAVGSGIAPAQAHAELLETTPEDGAVLETAPGTVELRFNEPVRLIEGAIRLFPRDGAPVALEARTVDTAVAISLPDDLGEGSYALTYRIVSADGHPVGGAITFQVGEGAPEHTAPDVTELETTPAATDALVSWLTVAQYLGLLVFSGLLFFAGAVMRAAPGNSPPARRLGRGSFIVAGLSSLFLIPASALRVTGAAPWAVVSPGTLTPGVLWQPVVAALIILAGGLAAILLAPSPEPRRRATAVVLSALTLTAPLLIGHTQTVQPGWAMLAADLGHLLAGAFWTGGAIGLLGFLALARPATRGAPPRTSPEVAARVVGLFSRYALGAVIFLAISGTVMAVLIFGSWEPVLGTVYGRTLLLKLGVVAAAIALAAWNRTRLLPRVLAHPSSTLQWASLRRILSYEAGLLIAVIAITGFLSNASPAHDHHATGTGAATAQETRLHAESQGLRVEGTITPTTAGQNTLRFRLEYRGQSVSSEEVGLEARLPAQDLGPFSATPLLDDTTGEYEADLTMPASGDWEIQITARVGTFEQPIAIIPITFP